MTKKITPNFLRHLLVLIIFSQSLNFFSQNVDITIRYSWPNYSVENKIELIDPNGAVIATLDNGYTGSANSADDNLSAPYVESNRPVNDNIPANSGYSVKIYDSYGDGWNGSGYAIINVDGTDVLTVNDSNFDNIPGSGGAISKQIYFAVTKALDNATFAYSKTSYCQTESNPTATITGEAGGTFSSTSGLIINTSTGEINLSTSTLGSYVVTYTTTDPDQNSSTENVTITDGDIATFSYATSTVNKNDVDLYPTTTGQSGSYSSTSGLSINSSTGLIDVSASTAGTYTVSYNTNGSCPKTYTDNVTIIDAAFPGVSQYQNSSKKYIEYIPGTMPIIISAPHGGRLEPSELPTRSCGTNEMDDNTDVLIKEIQKKCFDQFGAYPYIIVNRLHRKKLDPNRNESVATCNNANTKVYFDAFHGFIDAASADINSKFGKGLYIDLHGQSHSIPRIEAGYNLPNSSFDENLDNSSTNATELARVTIKNLIENNISNSSFEDLIRGANSFGGIMQVTGGERYADLGHAGCGRTEGYRIVPSNVGDGGQGSCDDTNPGSNAYFAGDYYSNIRHGSGNTSTANTVVQGGGTVNGGGGTIDGIMTEVNRRVRDLGNTYTSTYGVSDSRDATIPYFSRDYAKVIEKFIDIHYNDFSKFSYENNSYSINGLDVTPTVSGITGGNFTSTSGLIINTVTGKIDVSASTPGTYTVSYTAPNVGDHYKKEIEITINTDAVTNEFIATSGNWSLASNWSLNREPLAIDNVLIPTGKTAFLDANQKIVNDATISGNFVINSDRSLTVSGNLNNTGTFNINSGGSLIVNGTSLGNLTYNRNIDANKWYLVGSPLANQSVVDFVVAHPNITKGSGTGNNRNVALATFDNSKPTSQKWIYYKTGEVNGIDGDDTTDMMDSGLGYTTRVTSAGDISFTGTLNNNNVSKTVVQGLNSFNLVANPYPSYMNSADFLTGNSGAGKSLKTQTLWVWNQNLNGGLGDYETKITVQNFEIAPAQAFFVEVDNTLGVNFSKSSQSHQNTDTFLKTSRPEIKLNVTDGTNSKYTEIYYIDGTTTGFDNGYDGEVFGGITSSFQIFSGLVSNEEDKKLSIQSIPNSNHETMVIPIGVNAVSGSEIIFSSENKNIPNGLNVYLEDKTTNSFIELNENSSEYKVILTEDLNGTGTFYLHTRSKALATESESLTTINVFTNTKNEIVITGMVAKEISLDLFTILGKKVHTTKFSSEGNSKIKLPKLSKGIYLTKVKSNTSEVTKKIILE